MDKSSILKIVKNINNKLEKMKKQSEDIFSSKDENDFFQEFLNFCTSKNSLNKNYAQKTFFDKIKNWYTRYLGENRNINLEEFKFINNEAKLLVESICEKENLIQIKNIFNAWKKGFSYNYKNKFSFDVEYIQSELGNIVKILNKFEPKNFASSLGLEPETKVSKEIQKSSSTETLPPNKSEYIPSFIPASKITPIPAPPKVEIPKVSVEPSKPTELPPSKETPLPIDVDENTATIVSSLKDLGIEVNDKMQEKIKKLVSTNNIDYIIDMYNTGDVNAIKYILA